VETQAGRGDTSGRSLSPTYLTEDLTMPKKDHALAEVLTGTKVVKGLLDDPYQGDEAKRVQELLACGATIAGAIGDLKPEDTTAKEYYELKDELAAFVEKESRLLSRAPAAIQATHVASGFRTTVSPHSQWLVGKVMTLLFALLKEKLPALERVGRGQAPTADAAEVTPPAEEGEDKPKKAGKRHTLG
jgi:hypothetical protein